MGSNAQDVARRWFEEVWAQRRDAAIDELMAPDAPGHVEGAELRGPKEFRHMHDLLVTTFPDLVLHVEDVTGDGDHAVVRWHFHGTHSGPGLGVEPTNAKVEARGMTWLTVRDGRIVEGWDAWNMGALLESLRIAAGTS